MKALNIRFFSKELLRQTVFIVVSISLHAGNIDPLKFFSNPQIAGNLAMKNVLKFVVTHCDGLEKHIDSAELSNENFEACMLPSLFSFYFSHDEILRDRDTSPLYLPRKWKPEHVIAGIWNEQYFRGIKSNPHKITAKSCDDRDLSRFNSLSANSCLSEVLSQGMSHCSEIVKSCYAKDPEFYAAEFVPNYLLSRIAVSKALKSLQTLIDKKWKGQSSEQFTRSIFPAATAYFHGANTFSTMQEYYFAILCKLDDENCKYQKKRIGTILYRIMDDNKERFEKVYTAMTQLDSSYEGDTIHSFKRLREKVHSYQAVVDSQAGAMDMMNAVLNFTGEIDGPRHKLKEIFSMESGHNDFPVFDQRAVKAHFAMVQFMDWYRSYQKIDLLRYSQINAYSQTLDESQSYRDLAKEIKKYMYKETSSVFRYLEDLFGGPQ
ncbi:MAG: hypothetical protein AB8E15_13735 [Bdellovibrionales bacterium]